MPRVPRSLVLACVALCTCAGPNASDETSTGNDDTTGHVARCGDGIADEGEVCFQVERRTVNATVSILLPGDFDGDGSRDYYSDDGILGGHYAILAEEPTAMVTRHFGIFADEYGMEHMVYRASARDFDLDGKTDLLSLVQYHYWDGHVGSFAFGGIPMRAQPGFEFSYEALLFWQADPEVEDEPLDRIDGTFADLDGDGLDELFFAVNPYRAFVYDVVPGAAEGELFTVKQKLDLKPLALEDNIAAVAVDLDDDGRDDIILADGLGRVWTLHADPGGQLALHTFSETPVLPPMAGTMLTQDIDGDGIIDLVAANTKRDAGKLLPSEVVLARGTAGGGFERFASWTTSVGATQNSSPWGPQVCSVHLVLLDLDGSGYPALIYALRDERSLVIHPQVARTLGADPVVIPLDLVPLGVFADPQDDGSVDLLVSLEYDDNGTDDSSDDIGPYIDRYRLDP